MSSFPLGFSSIGMPNTSISEIFDTASDFQCDFVELRILGTGEELHQYLDEHNTPPVPVRVLGTSFLLTKPSPESMASFEKIAALADRCGARYLRVFGGGEFSSEPVPTETLQIAAETIRRCEALLRDRGLNCEVLLETHDALSASEDCLRLNALLDSPLNILWDSHHTWRLAGESPAGSWEKLAPLVRHVHVKDSKTTSAEKNKYQYVYQGTGEFPTADLFTTLRAGGYQGGVSLEWEKMWHPDLPPIPEALQSFQKLARVN